MVIWSNIEHFLCTFTTLLFLHGYKYNMIIQVQYDYQSTIRLSDLSLETACVHVHCFCCFFCMVISKIWLSKYNMTFDPILKPPSVLCYFWMVISTIW
jgi:hypothetical protein